MHSSLTCPKEREFASIFNEECIDLILLFLLKCGFDSKLLIAEIRPTFSEIDDTYANISFVIVKGGFYSPINTSNNFSQHLAYYLAYFLTLLYIINVKIQLPYSRNQHIKTHAPTSRQAHGPLCHFNYDI